MSVREGETLDGEQLALEKIMLALRTSKGVDEAFLRAECDVAALDSALESADLVRCGNGNVRIPENRFFVSDAIISEII
jgi:coproporphyrinogen III oxidase-like Fe-S oxidoreductase